MYSMQETGMEVCDYFRGAGQEIIFLDSGHRLIIGLASDGSTYLDKETWLPVAKDGKSATVTVSKINNYNEPVKEVYSLVKADLLLFQTKLKQVVSEHNISIILNFDVTMLDGIIGKRDFGLWLVKEHSFTIRSAPDSMEIRYMNDNMAANLYMNAKNKLKSTKDTTKVLKLQKEMDRQVREAFVFTIQMVINNADVSSPNVLTGRLTKRRKIILDDDDEF